MQIRSIAFDYRHFDSITREFLDSRHALTPLGLLLIALAAEYVWSRDYAASASFHLDGDLLSVSHPAFGDDNSLRLYEGRHFTVAAVEAAIREHLTKVVDAKRRRTEALQAEVGAAMRARDYISINKAKAAILATFTVYGELQHFDTSGDLYAFIDEGVEGFSSPLYVVRAIEGKFVGPIIVPHWGKTWFTDTPEQRLQRFLHQPLTP